MEDDYRTVAGACRFEPPKTKGSRFIASVAPVEDSPAAQAVVEAVRREFSDATHTCYAFRIDERTFRASDGGEPRGSAGQPILQQIDARRLLRVVVAVTRYYGGTKLGVGGLARAYGGAAAEALDRAGVRTVPVVKRLRVRFPYAVSGDVQAAVTAAGALTVGSSFGESVELVLEVPVQEAPGLAHELIERTAGRAEVEEA